MPQGLQVFDASGKLTFDTGERYGIVLGQADPLSASGSIVVPKFSYGEPFYFLQPRGSWTTALTNIPSVSISGTILNWSGGTSFWRLIWGVR